MFIFYVLLVSWSKVKCWTSNIFTDFFEKCLQVFLQCHGLLGGVERRANLLSTELSVETELLVRQLSFATRQVSMVESIRSFSHLCNASESNTARLTILMCPATILTFRTSDISYHQKLQPRLRGNYFFGFKVLCKAEVWLINARLMLASLRSGIPTKF